MDYAEQLTLFRHALIDHSREYGVDLSSDTTDLLVEYFELVLRWNERLHLVAPCSPQVFATRHVLESLVLLGHLTPAATVADAGSGGGLPVLPCLIARPDLRAVLIESSSKKTVFLREALKQVGRSSAATVLASRFEDTQTPLTQFVTCRALDNFIDKLEQLYSWSPAGSTLLMFGGKSLADKMTKAGYSFDEQQLPNSDQRFLYLLRKL